MECHLGPPGRALHLHCTTVAFLMGGFMLPFLKLAYCCCTFQHEPLHSLSKLCQIFFMSFPLLVTNKSSEKPNFISVFPASSTSREPTIQCHSYSRLAHHACMCRTASHCFYFVFLLSQRSVPWPELLEPPASAVDLLLLMDSPCLF